MEIPLDNLATIIDCLNGGLLLLIYVNIHLGETAIIHQLAT